MSDTKKCPLCAEEIKADAIRCKHCRSDLSGHQQSIVPKQLTAEEKRKKSKDEKRDQKILMWILIAIIGIVFWYITIPIAIGYALYKYTPVGKIARGFVQKNKKQVIAGGVGLFLLLVAFGAYQSNRQKKIDSYPEPQIRLSDTIETANFGTSYQLKVPVSNAISVEYSGKTYPVKDNEAIVPIDLTNQTVSVSLIAKNQYKEGTKTVTVKRNETEEERTTREAKEETERIAAEEKKKQEQLVIDEEAIKNITDQLNNLKKPLPEFNDGLEMTAHVALYKILYDEAQRHKNSENKQLATLANQAINIIPGLQSSNFPKLRRRLADILNDKLWIDDGKAYVQGGTASTLNIINNDFVLNKNIPPAYLAISETLRKLRFDRVNFKWSESGYSEYTYYDIESLPDNKVGG